MKIYVAGSGGKTSLIHYLAEQYRRKRKKVLILTTTHMMEEEGCLIYEDSLEAFRKQIKERLCRRGVVQAGRKAPDGKIFWIGQEAYKALEGCADVTLIEADGSKGLPAKMPNSTEPVILPDADEIYVVFGLLALGKRAGDVCHRIQLAEKIIKPGEILTEEAAARLLTEGYLKPLEEQYPKSAIKLVLNQADCDIVKEKGEQVAKETGYPAWVASLRQECKE